MFRRKKNQNQLKAFQPTTSSTAAATANARHKRTASTLTSRGAFMSRIFGILAGVMLLHVFLLETRETNHILEFYPTLPEEEVGNTEAFSSSQHDVEGNINIDTTAIFVPNDNSNSLHNGNNTDPSSEAFSSSQHDDEENINIDIDTTAIFVPNDNSNSLHNGNNTDPPLEAIKNKDGIAACLLFKDDNEKLPEWLAYHFLEMPLQYLIVAVDSGSITSPKKILDVWRNETGMDIVLWHDAHFRHYYQKTWNYRSNHLLRQQRFYAECIRHHKARGRKWLFIVDTDEFIANNVFFHHKEKDKQEWADNYILKPNQTLFDYALMKQKQREEREVEQTTTTTTNTTNHTQPIPKKKADPFMYDFTDDVCHPILRLQFLSVEEEDSHILHRQMPDRDDTVVGNNDIPLSTSTSTSTSVPTSLFDPMRFSTLRFFRHSGKDQKRNGLAKVILDLERVDYNEIPLKAKSPHRPIPTRCNPHKETKHPPLMIHHFIGTWEQFNWRNDKRRTREMYDFKCGDPQGKTYHLQGWLKRFVEKVGIYRSRLLLEGVGVLPDLAAHETSMMTLKDLPDYPKLNDFEKRKRYKGNSTHTEYLPYFGSHGEVIRIAKKKE